MKIFITCSTAFYSQIEPIKKELENLHHEIILPNGYPNENKKNYSTWTDEEYHEFFKKMYQESRTKIKSVDAILVLNYTKTTKNISSTNYIGASTFLEMYEAYMQNKKIYLYNDIPDNILKDEIKGFNPIIIRNNLEKI